MALFLIAGWSACVCAQSLDAIETKRVTYEHGGEKLTATEHARQWGLEVEDWQRYRTLMQGPRGLWYRDIDPVWVLGLSAETESERMRYARLAADIEGRRVEAELAFQRAYDDAWKEKSVDGKVLDSFRLAVRKGASKSRTTEHPLQSRVPPRRLVFVEIGCEACRAELLRSVQATGSGGVDLYVTGAATDDDIRQWAVRMDIKRQWVKDGLVTLNHDAGYFERLTGEALHGIRVFDNAAWARPLKARSR